MSSPSKTKGNNYEREIVKLAKQADLESERAYASNGKSLGYSEDVDLIIKTITKVYKVQAKRRKTLPSYLQPSESVDFTVFRQDRGETLALIRLTDLLELIKGLQ